MAKKQPNLKLVEGETESSPFESGSSPALEIISLGDMTSSEQKRVERLVRNACPRGGIVGVGRGIEPWDIRPLVVLSGETCPSLIRFFHPDVSSNTEALSRVRSQLESLSRFSDLSCELKDWGVFEGLLWYRRSMVESTLEHSLRETKAVESLSDVVQLIKRVVDEVSHWHSLGIVHGHIIPANIYVTDRDIALLDAGVCVSEMYCVKNKELPKHIAPEVKDDLDLDPSVDVYGLGCLIESLLRQLHTNYKASEIGKEEREKITQLKQFALLIKNPQAVKRPNISDIRAFIQDLLVDKRQTENDDSFPDFSEEELSGEFFDHPTKKINEQRHSPSTGKQIKNSQLHDFTITGTVPKSSNLWIVISLIASLALVFWVFAFGRPNFGSEIYTQDDLLLSWESKIPSKMRKVAEVALQPSASGAQAEEIIIRSVNQGADLPRGVDVGLLRIAFSGSWEGALTENDRRMALALGLVGLLGDKLPKEIGNLEEAHPGVILALAATAGERTSKILNRIPAIVLTKLEPPYGTAFAKLLSNKEGIDCGNEVVRAFARFATHGIERKQDMAAFLQSDFRIRLQALAILYSYQNDLATLFIDVLLNHPNIVIQEPEITWGRQAEVATWGELEPGDRLQLLAGFTPQKSLELVNIAKLFMHPEPSIRAFAIEQAVDRIRFGHTAALIVLERIRKQPELVTAPQLAKLAEILENPKKIAKENVQAWLETKPALEIVVQVLLGTVDAKEGTPFDSLLCMHLKDQNWQSDIITIKKLSSHPDAYTRLFAYDRIYRLNDKETARVFLGTALNKETNPEYRTQLQAMISSL